LSATLVHKQKIGITICEQYRNGKFYEANLVHQLQITRESPSTLVLRTIIIIFYYEKCRDVLQFTTLNCGFHFATHLLIGFVWFWWEENVIEVIFYGNLRISYKAILFFHSKLHFYFKKHINLYLFARDFYIKRQELDQKYYSKSCSQLHNVHQMTIAMIQFTLTTVVLLSCCAVSSGNVFFSFSRYSHQSHRSAWFLIQLNSVCIRYGSKWSRWCGGGGCGPKLHPGVRRLVRRYSFDEYIFGLIVIHSRQIPRNSQRRKYWDFGTCIQ